VDARSLLQPFVRLSDWRGLGLFTAGSALVGFVVYLLTASSVPALALFVASLGGFLAILGAVLSVWPAERKITVNRQAEVVGSRLALVLVVYLGLGFAILWGLNQISPTEARVPLAWDAPMTQFWRSTFLRRVGFWPFYALVLLGCHLGLPTPGGAC